MTTNSGASNFHLNVSPTAEPGDRATVSATGLGPWIGFAFVLTVAFLMLATQGWQNSVAASLSAAAREGLHSGTLMSGFATLFYAGLWLAWLIARPLIILGAFYALEWRLVGSPRSMPTTVFSLASHVGLTLLYYALAPWLQRWLPTDALGPLLTVERAYFPAVMLPVADALLFLAMLLVYGVSGYWVHRLQHQIPLLWRFHSVHHSIPHMDALNDVSHPIDAIGERIGLILISAVVGFEYETVAIVLALHSIRNALLHSRAPIHLGPLGIILVDNRFHLSHHSRRTKYFDRNYGGFVTLYDRLFGTYVAPDALVASSETGIPGKLPPRTPWRFVTATLEPDPRAPTTR